MQNFFAVASRMACRVSFNPRMHARKKTALIYFLNHFLKIVKKFEQTFHLMG